MGTRISAIRSKIFASVVTPSAGERSLYPKSDGWYDKDSGGVETKLTPARVVGIVGHQNTALLQSGQSPPATVIAAPTGGAVANTNFKTRLYRAVFSTIATAGDRCGFRQATAQYHLSSVAGAGGFHFIYRLVMETPQTGSRAFFGLSATTGLLAASDPSGLFNQIGFGWDAGDTQMQVMNNDGSGACTKTAVTGTSFAKSFTTGLWELHIIAPAGGGQSVTFYARELSTGQEFTTTITTNLPANDTFMANHVEMSNGTTTAIAALAFRNMIVETDA